MTTTLALLGYAAIGVAVAWGAGRFLAAPRPNDLYLPFDPDDNWDMTILSWLMVLAGLAWPLTVPVMAARRAARSATDTDEEDGS